MVRKKLAVVVAALGSLQAGVVGALGLGDFSLNSALNQPLDAEIKLLNTNDLDASQVIVRLAPAEDFKNAGVTRDFFLTNVKFNVIINDDGSGVIKVTSHDSVIEPYLDFLVEARWPNGRLLREYTVLLDLPVYSESQPVAAQPARVEQAPAAASSVISSSSSAKQLPASSGSSRQELSEGELVAGQQYRVRRSDTLWSIASRARPGDQASIQQTMLGIQRLNPEAFTAGNINNLKAGYVLRLPTEEEVRDISNQAAVNEVANQNKQWKTGEPMESGDQGPQLDASSTDSGGDDQASSAARLSLGSGGANTSGSDGSGASSEGILALQQELDEAKEGLDQSGRENQELQSRLQDLETRIATLQRLLELKDDQLASMQGSLGEGESVEVAAEDQLTDTGLAGNEAVEDAALEPAGDVLVEEVAEAELVDEDTAAQELPVAEEVQQQEPGLIDRVMANPLYAGSGLILLIGILLWLMRRNKKADAEFESEIEEDFDADAASVPAFVEEEPVLAAESEPTEDSSELEFDVDDFSAAIDEVDEPVVAGDNQQAVTSKPETGDAISEADIYIAYGRYQQAIDLLSAAIDNNPARTDLHVKLMEVYLETRDKPGFQQQYLKLQALQDDTAIVQVKEMLSTVDGVSGWLDGVGSGVAAISDEEMDQELIEGEEQGLQLDDAELDLDLDLDADIDDLAELTLEVEAADVVDTGFDDIELDLDESLLDDLSGSDTDTIQYDAADLEEALLASGVNDLELEEDTAKDLSSSATEEPAIDELVLAEDDAAAEPVEEDSFDLDIDLDSDFDLDLNDLSVDNADLEAEFGASQDAAKNDVVGDGDMDFEIAPELETASAAFDESPVSSELEQDGLEVDAPLSDQDTDFDIDTLATFDAEEAAAEFTGEGATDETAVSEEEDFDFLADTDEVATKLDLARAYIDMGDTEGAKDILDEVAQEGSEEQKQEASALLERID